MTTAAASCDGTRWVNEGRALRCHERSSFPMRPRGLVSEAIQVDAEVEVGGESERSSWRGGRLAVSWSRW